jgi:site-specific recombinase XerD
MLLVLLYATGARRVEALRIKVEDIDSLRMVINIRQVITGFYPDYFARFDSSEKR